MAMGRPRISRVRMPATADAPAGASPGCAAGSVMASSCLLLGNVLGARAGRSRPGSPPPRAGARSLSTPGARPSALTRALELALAVRRGALLGVALALLEQG